MIDVACGCCGKMVDRRTLTELQLPDGRKVLTGACCTTKALGLKVSAEALDEATKKYGPLALFAAMG